MTAHLLPIIQKQGAGFFDVELNDGDTSGSQGTMWHQRAWSLIWPCRDFRLLHSVDLCVLVLTGRLVWSTEDVQQTEWLFCFSGGKAFCYLGCQRHGSGLISDQYFAFTEDEIQAKDQTDGSARFTSGLCFGYTGAAWTIFEDVPGKPATKP